jgi:hypothetical protein
MTNSNATDNGEVERDVDEWMCKNCMRRLLDGPYESCPDCDCENVVPMRKWVVVKRDTIEATADHLNPTLASNSFGHGTVIQIYDADTGDKVWDIDEGWLNDE